ncbi:MAG: type II toxin-antitoxin system HicB family antitoxin [Anaerolineaceae bacterium]|nr:type II toxin-antitoxin system HicB family antitoxin [Anaerolineaceae bacterium]MDE0327751.1 type II toxin-antitoxin system HicB family antitoxin [Anaerolineaceae bacterium]
MIRDDLWEKAGELAARPYKVVTIEDTLTDETVVVVARNPELKGCLAQGLTAEEAIRELGEARQVYIYSLLEDNLPVPEPDALSLSVSGAPEVVAQFTVWSFSSGVRLEVFQETRGDYIPIVVESPRQTVLA